MFCRNIKNNLNILWYKRLFFKLEYLKAESKYEGEYEYKIQIFYSL